MPETEGVIQFEFELEPATGSPVGAHVLQTLLAWRMVLHRLELLGQTPGRYGGLGYGNLSVRDPERPREFAITASQTGGIRNLDENGLCRIRDYDLARFRVSAAGVQAPSSESLSHAMIYDADPDVRWVFHVHSHEIWQSAEALQIPATGADVAYGSPAMARAVEEVLATNGDRPLVFATLGHEDGVFACGGTARETGTSLIGLLARSIAA
ncbi:MAG: class II aldolase/adducin family protein [Gammaproteobacteria bacterium]|nr:class II aldolase/adducin family protein [Gammaproteobacteria bacterium]MDE0364391.1 class II aldolase/adducin family protein [Gammaproteobacteria bacterium]